MVEPRRGEVGVRPPDARVPRVMTTGKEHHPRADGDLVPRKREVLANAVTLRERSFSGRLKRNPSLITTDDWLTARASIVIELPLGMRPEGIPEVWSKPRVTDPERAVVLVETFPVSAHATLKDLEVLRTREEVRYVAEHHRVYIKERKP